MDPQLKDLQKGDIALVGLPFDDFSSFLKGPAKAPDKIREALHSGAMNLCSESGIDLGSVENFKDLGNLKEITHPKDVIEPIAQITHVGARVICLGGDHSLTYGIVKGHTRSHEDITILHLDAHSDLYDEFDDNRYSHACPFARIMEEGLVTRLVQIGIRTLNPHQEEQAKKFGVEIIQMKDWKNDISLDLPGPVYLSLDMDVLDPSFAPGVSHHEPGGFSTRELINFIQRQKMELIGADLVEYNPTRDTHGMTAMTCAKLLKEIVVKFLD